jgi:hypothetical protein
VLLEDSMLPYFRAWKIGEGIYFITSLWDIISQTTHRFIIKE